MESCVILPIRFVSGYGPDKSPGLHPPVTQPFGQIIGKVESPMIRKDEKTAVIEANRTHETVLDLVCRLLLEKKNKKLEQEM